MTIRDKCANTSEPAQQPVATSGAAEGHRESDMLPAPSPLNRTSGRLIAEVPR